MEIDLQLSMEARVKTYAIFYFEIKENHDFEESFQYQGKNEQVLNLLLKTWFLNDKATC